MAEDENIKEQLTNIEEQGNNPEKDSDNKQEKSEQEIQQEINEQTKKRAMQESKEYFKKRADTLGNFLNNNKDNIKNLLNQVKQGKGITTENLQNKLELSGEEKNEGFLLMVIEAIKDCKPIGDLGNAFELFSKRMQELMNPEKQLSEADKSYDTGASWYHTTNEGKARLQTIRQEVESYK